MPTVECQNVPVIGLIPYQNQKPDISAVFGSVGGDTRVTSNPEAKSSHGFHGFRSSVTKMNATCVLSGAGIRPGIHPPTIENIDIAPTIVKLLGLE